MPSAADYHINMVKVYFIACLEHIMSPIPPYYFNTSTEVNIEGDVDDLQKALVAEYSRKGIQNAIIYKVGLIVIFNLDIALI